MKTKKEKKIVVYGYARVSTKEQSLDVQTNQIKDYCKLREFDLVNVYTDKATGANNDRSGFQEMLSMLKNNPLGVNAVVIPKLDRIGRDVKNLINLIEHFQDTGVELISIADAIDTTTPSGRLFFHINAAYSQFERERINERTQEGRDYAKARGVKFGRPEKKLDFEKISRRIASGVTKTRIMQDEGISQSAFYRKWNEYKESLLSEDEKEEVNRLKKELERINNKAENV